MSNTIHTIKIEHCNNITEATISVEVNALNIKYAINGTGKSTISKALKLAADNKALDSLRPFRFIAKKEKTLKPNITNLPFSNVMVFDNEYLKQYIFQKTDLLSNAFEIFITSPEYDQMKANIDNELANIKNIARDQPTVAKMRDSLRGLIQLLSINKDGSSLSRKTAGAKSLLDDGKGAMFDAPDTLKIFKPFFDDTKSAEWAAWKLKGIHSFCEKGLCPFCADDETEEKKSRRKIFQDSFDEKSIQYANKLSEYLSGISEYISQDKLNNILEMLRPDCERNSLEMELVKLSQEAIYLLDRLDKLSMFDGYSIDQSKINELDNIFISLKIDLSSLDYYNTSKFADEIQPLNDKIDELIHMVGKLKGEIGKFKKYLDSQIKNKKQDINDFLASAGYNYMFDILVDRDNSAHAVLRYYIDEIVPFDVASPEESLSWGERNAFALILFMFDAVSKNADLIILDDPISSFDSNKKYAIIQRLFKSGKNTISFNNKTVVLLTHDLEPIIDYVQVGKKENVSACNLRNNYGQIVESPIRKNIDLFSMVVLLSELASDITYQLPVRIGCLRKFIEHTNKNPESNMAYNILSSMIHGRPCPTYDKEGICPLSPEDNLIGRDEIIRFINDFDYTAMTNDLEANNLLTMYSNESNHYFRLLILRAYTERDPSARKRMRDRDDILRKYVDETFHIENDYLYMLDVRRFNLIPDYFIKKSKDYVDSERIYLAETHSNLLVLTKSQYYNLEEVSREVTLYDIPASAGDGIDLFDCGSEDIHAIDDLCTFAVNIKGNSMEPAIPDKSIVFVKEKESINSYRIGIVRLNEKVYCKKVVYLADRVSLVSVNEEYEDIYVNSGEDDFTILGEVTGIVIPEMN